jgi:hypothetical protein
VHLVQSKFFCHVYSYHRPPLTITWTSAQPWTANTLALWVSPILKQTDCLTPSSRSRPSQRSHKPAPIPLILESHLLRDTFHVDCAPRHTAMPRISNRPWNAPFPWPHTTDYFMLMCVPGCWATHRDEPSHEYFDFRIMLILHAPLKKLFCVS